MNLSIFAIAFIVVSLCSPQFQAYATHCIIFGGDTGGGGGGGTPALENRTGIYIPLYVNPSSGGSAWNPLTTIIANHPDVPFLITINPSSGSGGSFSSNFDDGINNLQAYSNVIVIGYVFTDYGGRTQSDITDEIDNYVTWYNVEGIMFDEMSGSSGTLSYYQDLRDYVDITPFNFTRGNAGSDVSNVYPTNEVFNTYGIKEGTAFPTLGFLDGWHDDWPKSNWGYVVKDVTPTEFTTNESLIIQSTENVKWIYITHDGGLNPYDSISNYVDDLATILEGTY